MAKNPIVNERPPKSGGNPPKKDNPFGGKPPVVQTPTKKGTKEHQFAVWAQKQGFAGPTITDLWYWSQHTPNVDPYLWASVLLKESGGKHLDGNGKLVSSGQAVGIGQIALSWIGQPIPWNKSHKFTADTNPQTGIGNYGVNLRMSAFLWGSAVSQFGWQKAYTESYNPNDPNKQKAWAAILKTYKGRPAGNPPTYSPSQGPADTSPGSQTGTSTTPKPFKDPYIAGVTKGKESTAKPHFTYTDDPNRAMQYDGAPLTRSGFLSLKDSLTAHYVSYTGKRPSNAQVSEFLTKGWSTYQLDVLLSHSKTFKNSPIYKQNGIPLQDAVKDLLPPGAKVDPELLRKAIVRKWDATTLANELRKTPNYVKSNEFKGNVASLLNVHDSIMGHATTADMIGVRDAALAGWTADQYAAYLRAQPGYKNSTEYQSRALTLANALGLITGQQAVIAPNTDQGPGGTLAPNTMGPLPPDKRVPGTPTSDGALAGLGLGVTLDSR